jgi:putative Ig domain-containing protein
MLYRWILVLLLGGAASGCFSDDGSAQSAGGASATAAALATPAAHVLTLQGVPGTGVAVGEAYAFRPSVTSSTPVSYAIQGLPKWASFDTATGALTGTPTDLGLSGDITITASDGSNTGTVGPFDIRVLPAGTVPQRGTAPAIGGIPLTSASAGQPYVFQPTARDITGAPLTFAISNCPPWATFSTATGTLSGTPSAAQAGAYSNIEILVSDGTWTIALPAFSIAVSAGGSDMPLNSGTPPNSVIAPPPSSDAPTIGGTAQGSIAVGAAYSFQPTASDPGGKALTFAIAGRPVWAEFNLSTGRLSGTPTATDVGSYPGIEISVSDGTSTALLRAFSIIVTPMAASGGPSIAGTPSTSVVAGSGYRFTPTASDSSGAALTFSIQNTPSWATFNTATGELSGTPTAADVNTYAHIVISVSDGKTSVSLPAFSISVTENSNSSVSLSWTTPTQNANGTALTDLAGYYIYYGTSANQMTQSVKIANPGITSYVLSNLSPGIWYFSIVTYTTANEESTNSAVVSTRVD